MWENECMKACMTVKIGKQNLRDKYGIEWIRQKEYIEMNWFEQEEQIKLERIFL